MSQADLTGCNTLRLTSRADQTVRIVREAQLYELLERRSADEPLNLLGGGSNVVLKARVPGTALLMRTRGLRWERAGTCQVHVTAAAGERWHDLVRYTLGQGWSGLENLALIPGSVGAAPLQNIGAYGVELADRLVTLRALDVQTCTIRTFGRDDCSFSYRDSRFKQADDGRFIILDVTLRLFEKPQPVIDYPDLQLELERMGRAAPTPADVAEAVIRIRRRKLPDPRICGNAGSFFKNPVVSRARARDLAAAHPDLSMRAESQSRVKLSAAQLIDRCGWKGRRHGGAGVWRRQPLVLVNLGGATAADVLGLAEAIRRDVADRYAIELEIEPRIMGQD